MSSIDIRRPHDLGIEQARAIVEDIAEAMAHRFSVSSAWRGNTLHFERGGIHGGIEVGPDSVRVHAKLGLMFGMLKPTIEEEIRRQLDKRFG